jgi:hypothetical protein
MGCPKNTRISVVVKPSEVDALLMGAIDSGHLIGLSGFCANDICAGLAGALKVASSQRRGVGNV